MGVVCVICQFYGLRQIRYSGLASSRHAPVDSLSRFRDDRGGRGCREGVAAEAATIFYWEFAQAGLKYPFRFETSKAPQVWGAVAEGG